MKPLANMACSLRKDERAPLGPGVLRRLWNMSRDLMLESISIPLDEWLAGRVENGLWDHVEAAIREGLES